MKCHHCGKTADAKTWTTREGEEIPIAGMKTSHIRNSLAMLDRNGFVSMRTRDAALNCGTPNGEMAALAVEREIDAVLSRKPSHHIDWLEEELERRGED